MARKLNNKAGFEIPARYNYHQFQPLFYQVATAGLDASNISFPFAGKFFIKAGMCSSGWLKCSKLYLLKIKL